MKILKFLEEHVEKIVIAVVVILCLWLLITKVVFSPNTVEYDGKTFGPGEIDKHIAQKAEQLEIEINQDPEPKEDYQPRFDEFTKIFGSPLQNINTQLAFARPIYLETNKGELPQYALPEIPPVNDVAAEHIRAVAYVPEKEVTPDQPYTEQISEPNDIDLITVSGEFDLITLYERFEESFAGEDLRETWKDQSIAKPIVAGVQLQRQKRIDNEGWSEWQNVGRSKINPLPENFGIIEKISNLPAGGIKVRMLQFDNTSVMMDLLQPEPYRIASAGQQWLPPKLHAEYVKYQKQLEEKEKLEQILARKREKETQRDQAMQDRRARRDAIDNQPAVGGGGIGGPIGGGPGIGARGGVGGQRETSDIAERLRQRRSEELSAQNLEDVVTVDIDKIYEQFEEMTIDQDFKIEDVNKSVKFWAFDDNIEPDGEYRYRIRIGFFNPVAGTDKLAEDYQEYKDDAILWSDYSEVTDTIKVPKKLYFFARQAMEERNRATVQIFKYAMGYWYSNDFNVEAGEIIGGIASPKQTETASETSEGESVIPDKVNFATDAVMVDVFGPVKDWSGGKSLSQRYYYEMIYTYNGEDLHHMPAGTSYWDAQLRARFYELRRATDQPRKPLKSWSESTRLEREERQIPTREGMPPGMMGPGMGPGMYPGPGQQRNLRR